MENNTNSDLLIERLKFYADTPMKKNKLFCWELTSILTLKEALWRFFDKPEYYIRAAWYEKINKTTGEVVENTKIDVRKYEEIYLNEKTIYRKR